MRAPTAALGLAAAFVLAISLVAALLMWQTYRDAIRTAEMRAESAAQTVAAHIRWIGEAAYQALRRVDDGLGSRPDIFLAGTIGDLDEAVSALPPQVSVWVYDAQGRSVLTSSETAAEVNIADRPYFQALKRGDEWRISTLLEDRASGRKVFTIGRRIERNGEFLGAATIVVPAELLWEFWATLHLGPNSSVGLVRTDGWLVAQHPVPESTTDLSGGVLFKEHLPKAPAGAYHSPRSPADGVRRVVGYYTVSGLPLVAVARLSLDSAMARFWSQVGSAAAVALPIALALVAISTWLVSLLRRDERQRAELRHSLEQNTLLLREVHHRVKNNLQTVASLVQMQPLPPDAKRSLAARISAMAAAHQHLYLTGEVGSLPLAGFVRTLVEELSRSHGRAIEVECKLEEIEVGSDQAVPLGLIVNEVVTNALKHGFPNGRPGKILVSLERPAPERALLQIRDTGIGLARDHPEGGLGSRLIQGLARQISGEYAYESNGGTVFTLSFPAGAG